MGALQYNKLIGRAETAKHNSDRRAQMSKTRSIAAVATLLLAGIPIIALATSANAQPAVIKVSDLNLASPTGQKVFAQRADAAARTVCRVTPGTRAPNHACQAAGQQRKPNGHNSGTRSNA